MKEQTKTRPQETLEFERLKQMQSFSLTPTKSLSEEGKWSLGVTPFECTISVFNITDGKKSFSISIPCRWRIPNYLEDIIIDKLKRLLSLRSQRDI